MKLQKQPNPWSCFPTSLAMCLDVPVQEIFDILGHDGSEIFWTELPDPLRRRAFSFQEMIYVADLYSHAMVMYPAEFWVQGAAQVERKAIPTPPGFMNRALGRFKGVLTGKAMSGLRHAVAWNQKEILDPNGTVYGIEQFRTEILWAVFHANRSASRESRPELCKENLVSRPGRAA